LTVWACDTQESRQALEAEAGEALPMDRFRPNIVVSGAAAFQDDLWAAFDVHSSGDENTGSEAAGAVSFESVKPCSRCSIPQIDQQSGVRGKEPWPAMQRLRSGALLVPKGVLPPEKAGAWAKEVFMGWNVVALSEGVLRVGDAVTVSRLRGSA
jgi:uncharacterized protein